MSRTSRILLVTLGLVVAGALCGGIAGAVAIALGMHGTEGARFVTGDAIVVSALIGAAIGAVLGPAGAWLLLRHVPLGRALLGTMAGTVMGGALAWVLRFAIDPMPSPIIGAAVGFVVAAVLLRVQAARGRRVAAPGRGRSFGA